MLAQRRKKSTAHVVMDPPSRTPGRVVAQLGATWLLLGLWGVAGGLLGVGIISMAVGPVALPAVLPLFLFLGLRGRHLGAGAALAALAGAGASWTVTGLLIVPPGGAFRPILLVGGLLFITVGGVGLCIWYWGGREMIREASTTLAGPRVMIETLAVLAVATAIAIVMSVVSFQPKTAESEREAGVQREASGDVQEPGPSIPHMAEPGSRLP